MGMAASQARYLALSARKTNVEYEGQQINQQRLMLSNQSADLFNQMLTMSVPTPPNSSDYTKLQYSWNDGINTSVLESYYQLGTPNEEFNYVVTSYHYENVYTGQRKYLKDPQIQATRTNHFSDKKEHDYTIQSMTYLKDSDIYTFKVKDINDKDLTLTYRRSDQLSNVNTTEQLDYMFDRTTTTGSGTGYFQYDDANDTYKYFANGLGTGASVTYRKVDMENPTAFSELKQSYGGKFDKDKTYYTDGNNYICKEDIVAANETLINKTDIRKKDTNVYYTDGINYLSAQSLTNKKVGDKITVTSASNAPTFDNYTAVGNSELTQLDKDTYNSDATISTEIKQILKDMSVNSNDSVSYERLKKCFDDNGEYINGSLYQFKMNGKTYYTTAADLDESLLSAYDKNSIADNSIDSQQSKLSYYNALYVKTKVEEVKKALMETDGNGRFSTVKFEDDSVVYDLNVETVTDEAAYNDAMNQYYYKQEQYDKEVANINAKTEILQAQDRQLELQLEQLNTEQSALQNEMEACQKVVSKNVESSFKTFGG